MLLPGDTRSGTVLARLKHQSTCDSLVFQTMKRANLPLSMLREVNALMTQCQTICEIDPEMRDAVAMVYIGDIYSLREDIRAVNSGTREQRCYACRFAADP